MSTHTTDNKVKWNVEGMTCTNCAAGISKYLQKQGLENVSVNFATAEVRFDLPEDKKAQDIQKGIESLGYSVLDPTVSAEDTKKRAFTIEKKFYFTLIFTIPLLLHMFIHNEWLMNPYVQLALSTPVYLLGMWHFGKSALASLRSGVPNMDVLITMGSSAAFGYSLAGTIMQLGPDYLFYETAATIITLVLLGNMIEHRSVKQTTTAISELGKLQARKAKVLVGDDVVERDVDDVKVGDIVVVHTGDKVPFDGTITWGTGTVDESMVTGESLPVEREVGDKVIGATQLSHGSLKVQVDAVGDQSYLARIIELVKNAQQDKPDIQRLADKVSAVFVPVVTLIAVATFLLSYFVADVELGSSILRSVAVLAIACPCAMGLATPTAVMVGIGRVTTEGILIKGGKTIEQLADIEQVVFDKTGTLTTGNFRINEVHVFSGDKETAMSILLGLEKHSSHPIAQSIVRELKDVEPIELAHVEEIKGLGMQGLDKEANNYMAGSYAAVRELTTQNKMDVYVVKNGELLMGITIKDEIKAEAREVIDYLKSKNIRSIMLSGDRYEKCYQVAQSLGIDTFYAERKPDEKLETIEQLTLEARTAMVGDGINDAPALAKADIGISLSNASEAAIDSAQVILLNGDLIHLTKALGISNVTLSTIKQNLFWAFAYNVVAIPIAALGFLNPMVAALSMAFSDVVVVGNSLRLKFRKLK